MLPDLSLLLIPYRNRRLWAPEMPGHAVDPMPPPEERILGMPLLLHDLLAHGLFPNLAGEVQESAALGFESAFIRSSFSDPVRLSKILPFAIDPDAYARGLACGRDLRAALGGASGVEALLARARAIQAGLPRPTDPTQRIRVRLHPDATFSTEFTSDQPVQVEWTRLVLGAAACHVPDSWRVRLGAPLDPDPAVPALLADQRCPWRKTPLLPLSWGTHVGGILCCVPDVRWANSLFAERTLGDGRPLFLIQETLFRLPLRQAA